MPINDTYSNPIVQSTRNSVMKVGVPRARTISVFSGRGQEVRESIQYVPINYGMSSTPPNMGLGPTGISHSSTGSFDPTTNTFDPGLYPQTPPYPGTNPTNNTSNVQGNVYANPTLTGTVATSTSSTTVTGTGTLFTTQVLVGDVLYDTVTNTVIGTVSSITNNTTLVLAADASETVSANTVRTGDSIGTRYRIFKDVPAKYYLDDIEIYNAAITGATGFELGFYRSNPDYGPVVNASVLGTGLDLSAAHNYPTPLHAANALTLLQRSSYPLWEIDAGYFDTEPSALDLVLTSTVAPTASGIIMVKARWITPIA